MSAKIFYRNYLYSISTGTNNQGVALIYSSEDKLVTITPTQQYRVETELHLAAQHQIDQICLESETPLAGDYVQINGHRGVIQKMMEIDGTKKAMIVIEPKSIFRAIIDGMPSVHAQDGVISLLIEPGKLSRTSNKVTGEFFGMNNNSRLNFRINVTCWQTEVLPLVPR